MKRTLFGFALALSLLLSVAWIAQNTGYNSNQFNTATVGAIIIKSGALLTNTAIFAAGDGNYAVLSQNRNLVDSAGLVSADWGARQLLDAGGSVISVDYANRILGAGGNSPLTWWPGGVAVTTLTNAAATGGQIAVYDANKKLISATSATLSEVTSVTIPMGAWFNTFLDDGAALTAATFFAPTNTADGWAFADSVTNRIRTRLALPIDWDAGTVEMEIRALCTGTNSSLATNTVWAVRGAALGELDREDSPTFGTAVSVTNHISTNSYIQGVCITLPITVGNTPAATKSILWELQRWGADTGDTMTNSSVTVVETRLFFRRTTSNTFPTSSP